MAEKNTFEVQIDNCTGKELEQLFSRLDIENAQKLLTTLESVIERKEKHFSAIEEQNELQKKVCKFYLLELWKCVPDDEKEEMAAFFKEQAEEIDQI